MGLSKPRRQLDAQAWGEILRRFKGAGMTVAQFCKREGVGQSSFYHWRSQLALDSSDASGKAAKPCQPPSAFVDLGALNAVASPQTLPTQQGQLSLKLDLGGGLTLHLVRN